MVTSDEYLQTMIWSFGASIDRGQKPLVHTGATAHGHRSPPARGLDMQVSRPLI